MQKKILVGFHLGFILLLLLIVISWLILIYRENGLLFSISAFSLLLATIVVYYTSYKYYFFPLKEVHDYSTAIEEGDKEIKDLQLNSSHLKPTERAFQLLANQINFAAHFVEKIEKNQLDAKYEETEKLKAGEDELSRALLSMRDQMLKIEQENRQRNWATEGMAKFVEILRTNDEDDLSVLGDKIISTLVKYLNANQGGIFILNNENDQQPTIELIAAYAYDRKKYLQKSVEPGEGLIGQTYLEKETVYLTDVPSDYLEITSGLGDSPPNSIIIVPLKINEEVFGILEMASFHPFEKYQIDFLEKLGESIASSISSTKTSTRTKELLQQSQQQTEEMRAQEEEMRQNMEELEATQEEMRRVSKELEKEQEKLNVALRMAEMANLEISTDDYSLHLNNNFFHIFDTDVQTEGSYHLPFKQIQDKYGLADFNQLTIVIDKLAKMADSKHEEKVDISIKSGSGKIKYLTAALRAEISSSGNVDLVYGIIRNITTEKLLTQETEEQMAQMKAQEEEMRQNLEQMQEMQQQQEAMGKELESKVKELEEAGKEIEKTKVLEKQRADEQIAKRNKLMERAMAKFQEREKELLSEIEELKSKNK